MLKCKIVVAIVGLLLVSTALAVDNFGTSFLKNTWDVGWESAFDAVVAASR